MRLPFAVAVVLLGSVGCQCLVPVDDRRDAGGKSDGGGCSAASQCPQGGTCTGGAPFAQVAVCTNGVCGFVEAVCPTPDAGPGGDGGCSAPAQCSGTQPTTNWCAQTDAGFSCVERKCLWECPQTGAGRTCVIDGGCLTCAAQTVCPVNCSGTGNYATTVAAGAACTVWPGTTTPFTNVSVMRTASAQCHYTAFQTGGALQLGDIWRLSNGEYLTWFPAFGGWCTGRSAFTGMPRGIFNCPLCQFVLEGFE